MMLLRLSNEILYYIAEYLEARDRLSFALVAKGTKDLLLSALYRFNIQQQDSSALCWAAQHGQTRLVKQLVHQYRPNLNAVHNGNTPLLYAVKSKDRGLTQILLSHPTCSTEPRDRDGATALWHAVREMDLDITKLLLEKGADIAAPDINGETPLHQSIWSGKPSLTKLLLSYPKRRSPSELNIADDSVPLLAFAVQSEEAEMVQLLLDLEWDVNEVDEEGRTALHYAGKYGHYESVEVLSTNRQLDVNARDQSGSTALHHAARGGFTKVVNLLLSQANIHINIQDRNGCTALWYATVNKHHGAALRLLAEENVDVNAVGTFASLLGPSTSLHHAVYSRSPQIVQPLLAKTALNPNIIDKNGLTPLGLAAQNNYLRIVECLLGRSDVRVNAVEQDELPPLWLAASRGHVRVVQCLLQCPQINVNRRVGPYRCPLRAAIGGGHLDIAMHLVRCGTWLNVNARTYGGESVLLLAVRKERLGVIEQLLRDVRVDPNVVDDMGRTAFWWAAHAGQARIVKRLLEDNRVLTQLKDKNGVDALEAARYHRHFDVAGDIECQTSAKS